MPDSPLIRTPRIEDAALLGRVHQQCWIDAYGPHVDEDYWLHSTEERRIGAWERLIRRADPRRIALLAEDGDDVLGFAILGPPLEREHPGIPVAPGRELQHLYVAPGERGRGIGSALLAALPAEPIHAWVPAAFSRARHFLAARGFEPEGAAEDAARTLAGLPALRLLRA